LTARRIARCTGSPSRASSSTLHLADAVLGADRSAPLRSQDRARALISLPSSLPTRRGRHPAERARENGHCRRRGGRRRPRGCRGSGPRPAATRFDEFGHARDRHRDIVLHRRAKRALGGAISSRSSPEFLGLGSLAAIAASSTSPASKALSSSAARARQSRLLRVGRQLDQACHSCVPKRRAGAGLMGQHRIEAMARHHLEAFERIARPAFGMAQQPAASRTSAEPGPQHRPVGQRRKQPQASPPVTIPSVPSEPISKLLEVEPAVVLLERNQRVEHRCRRPAPPPAPAPARASCRGAAPACRRHWSRSARRWWPSPCRPESAGSAGLPGRGFVQVCRITPASHTASRASASSRRIAFIRRSDRSSAAPLASGVAPPDMPLLPPCGTIGTPCRAQSFTSARLRAVEAGEASASARPV
jgi:hypothetical protein